MASSIQHATTSRGLTSSTTYSCETPATVSDSVVGTGAGSDSGSDAPSVASTSRGLTSGGTEVKPREVLLARVLRRVLRRVLHLPRCPFQQPLTLTLALTLTLTLTLTLIDLVLLNPPVEAWFLPAQVQVLIPVLVSA